jgi:hypothetical protein
MPLKMRRFLDFAAPRLRTVLEKVAASVGQAWPMGPDLRDEAVDVPLKRSPCDDAS